MSFVLDASVTIAWCFQDEATLTTLTLLEKLATEEAIVPALWLLEIGNILLNAERKKGITRANIMKFINLLEALPIQADYSMTTQGLHEILNLATSQNLTTYDAAYLELAMHKGIPLATKDIKLQEAATRLGVLLY